MRLVIMGGVAIALVGFFIFLTVRLAAPRMALLYGNLEMADASRIVKLLESSNTPFEIKGNGSQIFAPEDQVLKLRVSMSQQVLPGGGSIGYELFDKTDALGTTNFIQNVNLVRALEGELSRTIRSIDNVVSARVHLVLPKRELFSREKRKASASIALNMRGGVRLDREQILAIQHLVAAAVPGLTPSRISIVDNRGSLLAPGFEDPSSEATQAAKADQRRRAFEANLERTIQELVEKIVGFGRVLAEVTAEMDFDRINTTEEQFDPDGQVVRSTTTSEQTVLSREAEEAPVSVGINLPDTDLGTAGGASASSSETRTEETVNYEISKKIINHIRDTGVIKRLSVAVLIDGTLIPAEDPDAEPTYQPRSEEEMELLATLVRGSIGFDADRGDTVEVVNMRFAVQIEEEIEERLELFFGLDKNDLLRMAEILVLSIVAILVILLVVRPLVTRAFEAMPSPAVVGERRLLADQAAAAAAALAAPAAPTGGEEEQFEELIDIDRVEGRVKASSVKKVGEIVDKHPQEALAIVRTWMYQEA